MPVRLIAIILFCLSTWVSAHADASIDETYVKRGNAGYASQLLDLLLGRANFDKSYALVVGVGKYDAFSQLDAPASDAIRVRDFLRDEE